MSEAFTDTTENRAAEAAAPGAGTAGRHRGPVARDDEAAQRPMSGPGRHRRPGERAFRGYGATPTGA